MGEEQQTDTSTKKPKKAPPKDLVIPPKKPKLSKAERRALQEKQRADKASGLKPGTSSKNKSQEVSSSSKPANKQQPSTSTNNTSTTTTTNTSTNNTSNTTNNVMKKGKMAMLFSHLPDYYTSSPLTHVNSQDLHPSVLRAGLQFYENKCVLSANERCRVMMEAVSDIVRDSDNLSELDPKTKAAFQFWTLYCRPHGVSMGNGMTFLKIAIANLARNSSQMTLDEAKDTLLEQIDAYVQERITVAGEAISQHAMSKIHSGDVILTYGCDEVIEKILIQVLSSDSTKQGQPSRIIVVDARPHQNRGRQFVEKLAASFPQIQTTYILMNALSYVMNEVTKVFLGADCLMSNGSVLASVGTAAVALVARSCNIPVLFCCESYKISPRVQLESITYNELGNPKDIAFINGEPSGLNNDDGDDRNQSSSLTLLKLMYDLTPSEYVTGIITEVGILPPTSVAVLLREMDHT